MAENQLASGGASAKAEPPPPPRPTITLPPRSSYESLFRFGGAASGVGGASEVSPGPMTLVSSFFAEDPDSDCRSFSQLLAGAMASPAAIPARAFPAAAEEMTSAPTDSGGGGGGLRSNQPLNLVVMRSPYFTVPPGLSPASLLESPAAGFFAAGSGQFGISHQQALAQVTAQAAQAHSHTHNQAEYPFLQASTSAPMTHPASVGMNMTLLQQMPLQTSDANNVNSESANASNYDRRSQPMGIIADKPADDGYNWRKYGQKQVKGSEYPRSYYKCTHPSCPVKKKVEHSFDGHVTEIIYKGQHNHQQPPPNKRNNGFSRGNNEPNASLGFHNNSDSLGGPQRQSSDGMSVSLISKRDRDSAHGASEQLSESSDGEEVGNAELGPNEGDVNNTDQKRRKIDTNVVESNSSQRVVSEPRIIVQTTSEVDLLDDGYRWRKYGQKVVKGNPHPRSYYKCTSAGCTVRKHVERASTDAKAVVTTYEGKHNHDVPTTRNNSHSTAGGGGAVPNNAHSKLHNTIPNNQHLPRRPDLRNGLQRPIPVRLKEEHDAM